MVSIPVCHTGDPGSIPGQRSSLPSFLTQIADSIVVSIPVCHTGDPGSIPGQRKLVLLQFSVLLAQRTRRVTTDHEILGSNPR